MKYGRTLSGLLVAGALMSAGAVQASTVVYEFDRLLSGDPSLSGIDFAKLTVDTGGTQADPWRFRLEAYGLSEFGSKSFFGALAVDGAGSRIKILNTTSGSGIAKVGYKSGKGPGGGFDFRFSLTGPRKDRVTQNEWVEWTVSGLSSISGFGAHIQGIGRRGKDSAWYGSSPLPGPVPLPATFWLLGSAFLGFAGIKRWFRRRDNTSPAVAFQDRPALALQ